MSEMPQKLVRFMLCFPVDFVFFSAGEEALISAVSSKAADG